jgi:K+-sensing histidine kinase KdpD
VVKNRRQIETVSAMAISGRGATDGRTNGAAQLRPGPLGAQGVAMLRQAPAYGWTLAAVALATLAGLALTRVVPLPNVSMVFLLAVLFAATRFGLRPALLASALSFLSYNFFFIEPLHSFSVTQPHELLALFVLLAVAVLTSAIAGRARDQARTAIERARLAEEVNAVRATAEAERVRNTLLASVSHDFRTPLASILGAATSLIDYGALLPEHARRDLLAQVKDEAEHLDGMVRNLLAMTRVQAGALEINRDWIDVRELFDRAVAIAKRRGAMQSFEVSVAPELPFVPADQTLLDQVLANLIGNATRYAGQHARVTLAADVAEGAVRLRVADDGPGIPAIVLPHVFEKFVRARQSGGDAGEGSGLGLAIAKGIVEAHGGSISAQSPVAHGRGTCITLRLPLAGDSP